MKQGRICIVFAGGGTGGHLYPALAMAAEVRRRRPEAEIVFIGTRGKIEARVVPEQGYVFRAIWISGLVRGLSPATLLLPLKALVATLQSLGILLRLKPALVVGTGGYVSGPPLLVASFLGIPTLIQEQNSYPGITTRLLAKRVTEVHLTFEGTKRYLRGGLNVRVTGNPTRDVIGTIERNEGAHYFGVDPSRKTVLVIGGSQGAASINRALLGALGALGADGVQVIWGTGGRDYEHVESAVGALGDDVRRLVVVRRYLEKIEYAFAACDVAVSRAGATTLAELTKAGIPSLLVPYPFAAADHQNENARAMVKAGASVLCNDAELEQTLLPTLRGLLADAAALKRMAEAARNVGNPQAAGLLAEAILRLAEA